MTTTSYAILGLLAVRPWTTHELVQQVDRSLRRIWPRAQSKLYEEPKKLVAHGYAKATDDSVGRRRRTRYTITAKGRRAFAAWLQQPGDGPALEFEQLVKIHFSDSGTKADVIANLEATRAWVLEQNGENLAAARAYLAGEGPVPGAGGDQPARRTIPDRVLRHRRPLGGLGDSDGRNLARRCSQRAVRRHRRTNSGGAGRNRERDPGVAQPLIGVADQVWAVQGLDDPQVAGNSSVTIRPARTPLTAVTKT